MPAKPAKPVPFCTIGIDKVSAGAAVVGHRFDLSGTLFVFDCPESIAGVLRTLADQYQHGQITLRVTVEAFLREPSR